MVVLREETYSLFTVTYYFKCGGVAHLGERLNGIQEVVGSIPIISTKQKPQPIGCGFLFVFIETAPPSRGGFAMGCFSKAAAADNAIW